MRLAVFLALARAPPAPQEQVPQALMTGATKLQAITLPTVQRKTAQTYTLAHRCFSLFVCSSAVKPQVKFEPTLHEAHAASKAGLDWVSVATSFSSLPCQILRRCVVPFAPQLVCLCIWQRADQGRWVRLSNPCACQHRHPHTMITQHLCTRCRLLTAGRWKLVVVSWVYSTCGKLCAVRTPHAAHHGPSSSIERHDAGVMPGKQPQQLQPPADAVCSTDLAVPNQGTTPSAAPAHVGRHSVGSV